MKTVFKWISSVIDDLFNSNYTSNPYKEYKKKDYKNDKWYY